MRPRQWRILGGKRGGDVGILLGQPCRAAARNIPWVWPAT